MIYLCKFRGCERFSDCPLDHRLTVIEHSDPDETTGEPLYFAVCDEVDHTVTALTKLDLMPDDSPGTDDKAEQNKAQINAPDLSCLAKEVITEIRKQPLDARLVDVAPSAGKPLRAAMKDPGGRPKKKSGGTKIATQGETAISFGAPCTESKIANWEAYERTNGQRGSRPFGFITKDGERIIYSAELRTNPTPDNGKRLTALIAEFQSRHRIKEAIGEKAHHFKSPETLAKASGQTAAAIREQSQLKYAK